jgi:hypothetical protein
MLAIVGGSSALPHQSDRIHTEARLLSQIVPLDPADAQGVGRSRPGTSRS